MLYARPDTVDADVPVVSEEDAESLHVPAKHSLFWLVDPLDGTKEFINKNGEFTCNLALIDRQRAVFGFVGVPAQELVYVGGPNRGAFRVSARSQVDPIHCHRAMTETRVVASQSHLNADTQQFIDALPKPVSFVQAGSSLKFLMIAEGHADCYPRLAPTCEWDTAAAHAVLEGAGGTVTQVNGADMRYGKSDVLNPHFIASARYG